jgi:general secretion pathway protein K
MKSQQGIALVQVLIISIVLISLGLFISQTVKSQVSSAQNMSNAFQLRLKINNAEASLLQTLLSYQRYQNKSSQSEIVQVWNFHNDEFTLKNGVTIKIQDLTSLLSLNYTDKFLARNLLVELGVSGQKANSFIEALEDWKDKDDLTSTNGAERNYYRSQNTAGPRNGFLQSLSEVEYIKDADVLTYEQWRENTSIELISAFNPLNSPPIVLKSVIKNASAVDEVIELRAQGKLTGYEFNRITGIEQDEFLNFSTGQRLLVSIKADESLLDSFADNPNKQIIKQQVMKKFIVTLKARSQLQPIIITDMTWNTP